MTGSRRSPMHTVAFAATLPLRSTAAFPASATSAIAVPVRPARPLTARPCRPPIELKKGGGSKRARKAAKSSSQKPSPLARPSAAGSPVDAGADASANTGPPAQADGPAFPGPLAPDALDADGALPVDGPVPGGAAPSPPQQRFDAEEEPELRAGLDDEELPVADESRLRLPDLGARDGPKRRKRRAVRDEGGDDGRAGGEDGSETGDGVTEMPAERVAELTRAYRMGDALGGADRQAMIDEIEKEPDFLLKVGEAGAATEYDFTSALFGRGRPNKQGIYVLPYLQSGHMLLLAILSLIAFVYYPGFPLTEAPDELRFVLRNGIVIALTVNAGLAVFAYRLAAVRNQPAAFWALKTMALGDLAFGELRRNTRPEVESGRRGRSGGKGGKKKSEKRRRPASKS